MKIHGVSKTHMRKVTADVAAGTSVVTLDSAPERWRVGDHVVLAGTYFRREHPMQDERFPIASISGATITIDGEFQYDHLRVTSGSTTPALHLVNLTRNVTFRSETTATAEDRGHVMLMHADSTLDNVAFVNLGRTDKSIPLDDFELDDPESPTKLVKPAAADVANRRGRYAVHVHMTRMNPASGQDEEDPVPVHPPTVVTGCVVDGTLGWGFVNHSSHVDFRRDVAYNFTGAGFVTEAGDELGNFIEDVAIRGIGQLGANGQPAYFKARLNFGNPDRPQPIADIAFSGQGFWFSGPAVRVRDIVANSCNGDGVIWHTTGTVDVLQSDAARGVQSGDAPYGRYTPFPEGWIDDVYGTMIPSGFEPRHWETGPTDDVVIADLPILECHNVDSYANLIGFRLRFNNFDSIVWYNEDPYDYVSQMLAAPGTGGDKHLLPTRVQEVIDGTIHLWNNEEAFSARYVSHATMNNVSAINRLDYDSAKPENNPGLQFADGIESSFKLHKLIWNEPLLDGYELALWTVNGTNTATDIDVNSPVYRNYASRKRHIEPLPCLPLAEKPTATPGSGTATITWTAPSDPNRERYLLRYKATDAQQWKFLPIENPAATSASLSGLTAGKTYWVQVDCGCTDGISNWSRAAAFVGQ